MLTHIKNGFPKIFFHILGLKLILRVSDQENKDLIRDEVGARVTIHDPFDLPFVDEYGINVRPMDMTAIAISQSVVTRLGKPYGNCQKEESSGNKKLLYSIMVILLLRFI